MLQDLKLKLRNSAPAYCYIPDHWKVNGSIYFDLDTDFKIALSKEVIKLSNINEITVETTVNTSLPATDKNKALLRVSMDVESFDNTYPDHSVDVELCHRVLNQNNLRVTGYDRKSNRIDIEITEDSGHWIKYIKENYLDGLDLGEFEYTDQNLIDNFINNAKYLDGDPGYYMGHVFYGRYVNYAEKQPVLNPADFRPLVHAKKVFDLSFCNAGWGVRCPLLETDKGRKLVTYINKEDFNNSPEQIAHIKFSSQLTGTVKRKAIITKKEFFYSKLNKTGATDQKLKFNIELEDPSNAYDPATGIFTKAGIFDFEVHLFPQILIESGSTFGGGAQVIFRLIKEHNDGFVEEIDSFDTSTLKSAYVFEDEITFFGSGVIVNPGDKVYVSYQANGSNLTGVWMRSGSSFKNNPIRNYLQAGDKINVGENLRHDTILDFIKGICHLYNLHVYTDFSNNTVYFLTPYDIEYYSENIGGFYKSELTDWKPKLIQDTEKYIQAEKVEKNLILCFKKSTDEKIKSYKWDQYEPYSRFIDNGFSKDDPDKNEVMENPYFEATYSDVTNLGLNGDKIEAPYMLDNLEGNLSFKIAPRILFAGGFEPLYYTYSTAQNQWFDFAEYHLFTFNNIVYNIPHVYQVCHQATGAVGIFPNTTLTVPSNKIAYGWYEDDLYTMFYQRWIKEFKNTPTLQFKTVLGVEDYFVEDFRNRMLISSPNIHTGDLMARLLAISGYEPISQTAELTFKADNQSLNDCNGFEIPFTCENYPVLTVTPSGADYNFTRTGTVASTVSATIFKWRYLNAVGPWHETSTATAPADDFEVIMEVIFSDGCPKIFKHEIVKVQGKYPVLVFTRTKNILVVTEEGDHSTGIATQVIDYTLDGTNWQRYQEPIDLEKITTTDVIQFRVLVTYSDASRSSGTEANYVIDPKENECPDPDQQQYPPTVVYSKTAQTYFLHKTGNYVGTAAIDKIQFREKGKSQEWTDYDEKIILSLQKCWEYQRVIVWCGYGCANYCSPIGQTDCGSCTGTLLTPAATPTSETCTHEQKWENPDTGLANWKVEPIDNEIYHVPSLRSWIKRMTGVVETEITERTVIWDRWNFKTEFLYNWNLDYKLNWIKVHTADSLGIGAQLTIPINITYSTGNTNDELAAQIQFEIENYLLTQDYLREVNYKLIVTITGTTTKALGIAFVAKHNPVDTWIGARLGVDQMEVESSTAVTSLVDCTGKEFQIESTIQPIIENTTVYGNSFKVRFKVSTSTYFLEDSLCNFNELVPLVAPILTDTLSTALTDTGKKFSMTGSLPGCSGTVHYTWKHGGNNISYVAAAVVYTDKTVTVRLICKCDTATYCYYHKEFQLTV